MYCYSCRLAMRNSSCHLLVGRSIRTAAFRFEQHESYQKIVATIWRAINQKIGSDSGAWSRNAFFAS
jgi:hypothetical protein